jgi:hypothetical protein
MRLSSFIFLLVLTFAAPHALRAQSAATGVSREDTSCGAQSSALMILGTYHMNNPGLDGRNLEADDVLLPRRQREIADLIERLARFNPTKIAIEGAYSDKAYWNGRYKKFLSGEHKLTRNEIEQIGFQLAKRLNHEALYPIDYPMMMSGLRYDEIEFKKPAPTPQPTPNAGEVKSAPPQKLSEEEELLRRSTVSEFLLYINDPQKVRKHHGEDYMRQLLPGDDAALYERADRLTNWYKRNLRMFANVNRVTEFPKDRLLLIVGSGHLKILRDFALDSPQFCLVEPDTYLK